MEERILFVYIMVIVAFYDKGAKTTKDKLKSIVICLLIAGVLHAIGYGLFLLVEKFI